MTRRAALGIDLGTSSVKVVVLDVDTGQVLGQAGAAYPVHRPHPGWAETDPQEWWAAVRQAAAWARAAAGEPQITGIGLSGQMHGVVLVTAAGEPVRPAILWADARAGDELDVYRGLEPALRSRLANPLSPGMAGPILGWLHRHEPATVAAASAAIAPKDWIRARLTGAVAAEASDASATLLYDVLEEDWSAPTAAALGIRAELLAPIHPNSLAHAGELRADAAADLVLPQGIPVAAGAADTAAALLGSGLTEVGAVQLTIGTGVQIVTPVAAPTPETVAALGDPVSHLYRAAGPGDWYAMAAGLTGGQTLAWVIGVLGVDWAQLYAAAGREPAADDPVFLPHLVGERTPYLDTSMRGAWTGLDARHDREALLYAALEGVAFAAADGLDALPGIPPSGRELRIAGGGTTDPRFRQLLADALDAQLAAVEVPSASGRGAALTGLAVATGARSVADLGGGGAVEPVAQPGAHRELLAARRRTYRVRLAALRAHPSGESSGRAASA
ncbi:MAG: FGGY family carbohydrate kinase [Tetrasphaera sp.]